MKKTWILFLLLSIVISSCEKMDKKSTTVSETETIKDQTPTEIIISKELEALTRWSHGDPYGYIDIAADDITYYAEGCDTLITGIKDFTSVNAALEGKISIPHLELKNPKVEMYGNVGIFTFVLHNFNDERELTSRWKTTEVYEKIDNDWKLVHSHWSLVR